MRLNFETLATPCLCCEIFMPKGYLILTIVDSDRDPIFSHGPTASNTSAYGLYIYIFWPDHCVDGNDRYVKHSVVEISLGQLVSWKNLVVES